MDHLCQWFRRPARKPRRSIVRLNVEQLECREVLTALINNGGPVIPNVQVETVFFGANWSNPQQNQQSATYLNGYFKWITGTSGYLDMLNQYGVGRGVLLGSDVVASVPQSGTLSDTTIQAFLTQQIQAPAVPAPTMSRLYFVFTAPGVVVTNAGTNSINDFLGYHSHYTGPGGATVLYAVVDHPTYPNALLPHLNQLQQLTEVSSHELAEATTDPLGNAWWDSNPKSPTKGDEIGDIVNAQYGTVDGYVVQKEWSNKDNTGILPAATAALRGFTNTGGALKAIVGGIGEVFGLDGNDNVWVYRDATGTWTNTGGVGTQISAGLDLNGNDELWVVAPDGGVFRYDASGNWYFTGGYLKTIAAGQTEVFGLDKNGVLWVYNDYFGWVNSDGYASSISVGIDTYGQDEVWVHAFNDGIFRYEDGQWGFTQGYLKTITAGQGEVFGLDAGGGIWLFNDYSGWTNTGGYGKSLSAGIDSLGQDELWVIAPDGGVWRYDAYGNWFYTQGGLNAILAGQKEVFGLDANNLLWFYNDATGWTDTGGKAADLSFGVDVQGADEIWVRAADNSIFRYQTNG